MDDSEIRVFFGIPVVAERWDYAKELAESIGLTKENLFLDSKHRGCLWNKMRIYDHAAKLGYTHVCINDDDCIVCDNYKSLVLKCVKRFPDAVITFYDNEISHSDTFFIRRPNCQLSGTAFVIPLKFLDDYKEFYNRHLAQYRFDWEETVTKMFCMMNDIDVYLTVPNLVDVREGLVTTARKGKWIQPQSASFTKEIPASQIESREIGTSSKGGLFNLHLRRECDTAQMILQKWRRVNGN